jgi:hypothetical protein
LANGNFLATSSNVKPELKNVELVKSNLEKAYAGLVSVYPNPVTDNNITLSFNKVPNGDYTLELTDIVGRQILQQRIVVQGEGQTQNISLDPGNARGTYLLRMVNRSKQTVYSQKVLVQ